MRKTDSSSSPSIGSSNLEQREVSETWYLDPAEWEQVRLDVQYAYDLSGHIKKLRWPTYMFFRQRGYFYYRQWWIKYQMRSLKTKALQMRKILQRALTPDRILEFRRFVHEWRKEARQLNVSVANTLHRLATVELPSRMRVREQKFRKSQEDIRKLMVVAHRLRRREELLLKAIAAGMYLSTTDAHVLHKKGVLTDRQFRAILELTVRVYEGRNTVPFSTGRPIIGRPIGKRA